MSNMSTYTKTIFKERKITDYLESKGIFPQRESKNKKMYLCPIHKGDTSPSFTVYLDSEYQNYYCFGCHSGTSIVNLVADMEGINTKLAFKKLLTGLNVPKEAILNDSLSNYQDLLESEEYADLVTMADVEEISLKISVSCYNFLESIANFDNQEIVFFEKIFKRIDELTMAKSKKKLEQLYYFINEEGLLYRAKCLDRRKELEENAKYNRDNDEDIWSLQL